MFLVQYLLQNWIPELVLFSVFLMLCGCHDVNTRSCHRFCLLITSGLLLKVSDIKGRLPWEPYTVEGEVFVHHLIRQWCCLWDLDMRKSSLTKLHLELVTLSHARQAQTALKQVFVCAFVCVCVYVCFSMCVCSQIFIINE